MAEDSSMRNKRKENLGNAVNYLERAVATCRKINFDGPCIEFCQFLSNAYLSSENHKRALEVFKQYTDMRDSVFSQENRLKMDALEAKRVIELKNKDLLLKDRQIQIEKLQVTNKKNERIIFLITIGLLFIIIFLLYRIYNMRAKTHKKILSDIANIQSHQVRAPLARILGLAQLFDEEDITADINKQVVIMMNKSAHELDEVIKRIVDKASE
jgi:signal transduction histidine kinase